MVLLALGGARTTASAVLGGRPTCAPKKKRLLELEKVKPATEIAHYQVTNPARRRFNQ